MNRRIATVQVSVLGVPRTRGDEPGGPNVFTTSWMCSPHTRG
ncbi:hypothetical protein B932_0098 [Gluconobacter oxydans H24]|nr:hypothetical protein B932_0098 [Gluconobacter oxydans H24]